jgi:tyrosyl-tRNA synthetase
MSLAREIVEIYYGDGSAAEAEKHFRQVFQEGGEPEDMETFQLSGDTGLIDVLANSGMVSSRSEARRLVEQGGVRLNDEVLEDPNQDLVSAAGGVRPAAYCEWESGVSSNCSRRTIN